MTMAFANYLAAFLKKRVAVYEYGQRNDFVRIYQSVYGDREPETKGSFVYEKVAYYMKGSVSVQALAGYPFDVIIIDFGSSASVPSEFLRCHHKMVLSSMQPWYCKKYEEFCDGLMDYRGSEVWLHVIGSDNKEIKRIRRTYGVMAIERPGINNAYVIDQNLIRFFQTLFL